MMTSFECQDPVELATRLPVDLAVHEWFGHGDLTDKILTESSNVWGHSEKTTIYELGS